MRTLQTTTVEPPYNLNEAARALGRSTATISYWLEKGELVEVPSRGRQRLITSESVQAKAEQIGVELAQAASA